MVVPLNAVLGFICAKGNCAADLAKELFLMLPQLFEGIKNPPTSFKDLINYFVDKYTKGAIELGKNIPLPPPLSFLWGQELLKKHGPESCTLSAFPMQNTIEYHFDDKVLVEQYCNLANYVWCNGKPDDCQRKGGAIFAHSTGALTLLTGLGKNYDVHRFWKTSDTFVFFG